MDISFAFRKIQKSIAGLSVLAVLTSLVSFTGIASAYDDLDEDHYAYDAIMEAADEGWMTGYENGDFGADDSLTRAQAAKIFLLGSGLDLVEDCETDFTDVPTTHALYDYVCSAEAYGIVSGRTDADGDLTGKYDPDAALTRAEGAKLAVETFGLTSVSEGLDNFPDVDAGEWFEMADTYYVSTAWSWSVVNGFENGYFYPGYNFTRGQAAIVVNNSQEPEWRDVEVVEPGDSDATLDVSLSSDSPDSMTIPASANSVEVAAFDFEANGDDLTVDGFELRQYGVANLASGHELFVYWGDERLTSGATVNSSTNVVEFNNVDLTVMDGDTETLTIRMNVGATATTGEFGLEMVSADAVDTNAASVDGDFPVQSETHTLSTTAVGGVTIAKNGSLTDPSVGEKDAVIAEFSVEAGSDSIALQELGLYVSGTINTDDLENLKLYDEATDELLAEVDGVDSQDVARFSLEDNEYDSDDDEENCGAYMGYCIENGSSVNLYVTADLATGRTGDTVEVYVDEEADFFALDTKYGFGAVPTITNYDGNFDGCASSSSADCSHVTLEGGEITIESHDYASTDAAINQDDVSILNFTITTQSDVTFRNFVLQLSADESTAASGLLNSSTPNFTDIRITTVEGESDDFTWGPIDADDLYTTVGGATLVSESADATGYYVFENDFDLDAGDSREFEVTLNIENNTSLANDGVTAGVVINSTYPEIRDENGDTLTNSSSLVPTTTFTGDEFNIEQNTLTVTRNSGVSSSTEVSGSQEAVLGSFILSAGDAEDLELDDITFTGYFDTDSSGTFTAGTTFASVIGEVRLYSDEISDDNELGSDGPDTTTGRIEFENLNYSIPSGTDVTLFVVGNVSNLSTYVGYRVKADIADVSADIEVTDEDGDVVTSNSSDAPNYGTVDNGTIVTVSAGGTLSVDVNSDTRASQIVVAGTDDNLFGTLRLTATGESFRVNELTIRNGYSAAVGDYDDNLDAVYISYYTDADQEEESTATCSSQGNGSYSCNIGSDNMIYVPDSDLTGVPDYALVTVYADLATTASSAADEGDRPDLTLSLLDFEARGVDSQKKIEEGGTYDLAITDITLGGYNNALSGMDGLLAAAISSATATTLTLDNGGGADAGDVDMIGGFICFDDNTANNACDSTEEQAYVSAVTDGTTDTYTISRGVNGTTAVTHADNANVLFLSPSVVLDTNFMQVQATDLDAAVASSTRTGSRSATEQVMTFSLTANATKDAVIRAALGAGDTSYGEESAAPTALTAGPSSVTRVSSTPTPVAGTYAVKLADAAALASGDGGSIDTGAVGLIDDAIYPYASVWIYIHDDATTGNTVSEAQLNMFTSTTSTVADQSTALGSSGTALGEERWLFFPQVAVPSATDAGDRYAGIRIGTAMGDAADYIAFDDLRFYSEKINVDLTLNEAWSSITPTVAYLKQDGVTRAIGYVDYDGDANLKTGQIQFAPTGTYGEISISGTDSFVVEMNTSTAIDDSSTATEQLTASIELGNVSTTGDIYWYDGEDILTFLGVNSTDRVEVTTSY